jgi:NAD(P)-dependent dehydrogenase (short-subunit alcohol dehydrogenase family)
MKLDGLVAAISGGVSGLGEATARRLLAAEDPRRILFQHCDMASEQAVDAAVAAAVAHFGALHVAVHCAAIGGPARLISRKGALPMAGFDQVMKVNLYGALHLMRAAVPAMIGNPPNEDGERGVIVNVSSGAAWDGQVGQIAYAASKAAIVGMTTPLMRELAQHGIRVTAIAPGAFDTPIYDGAPPALKQSLIEHSLFPRRMGKPDEFAMLVEEIVRNPMHNGRTYRLDAGMAMPPS